MTREEEIITACKGFLAAYPNIDQAVQKHQKTERRIVC